MRGALNGEDNPPISLTPQEEILLENFRLLVSYISGDEKLFWDRFNIFTVLTSALWGVSFLEQTTKDPHAMLILSFFGVALSLLWFLITARARAYIRHWTRLARDIEERKLKDITFFKEEARFGTALKCYERLPTMLVAMLVPLLSLTL